VAGSVELVDVSAELKNLQYKNGLNNWKVTYISKLRNTSI